MLAKGVAERERVRDEVGVGFREMEVEVCDGGAVAVGVTEDAGEERVVGEAVGLYGLEEE